MSVTSTKWRFRCAGTFAGCSSFKDDDEVMHYYLKCDYYGGKVAVEISHRDFENISGSKLPGCDVRLGGIALINGGQVKLLLESCKFEKDKGFEPVDLTEMIAGMTCEGFGGISFKRSWEREDSSVGCSCTITASGGILRGIAVEPASYDKIPEGPCIIQANVMTEVSNSFVDGRPKTSVRNILTVKGAKSL